MAAVVLAQQHRHALSGTQEPALPRDWLPGIKPRQRVPDHGALVGDGGPAELPFERLADRLRQPGAAADIEADGPKSGHTRITPTRVDCGTSVRLHPSSAWLENEPSRASVY